MTSRSRCLTAHPRVLGPPTPAVLRDQVIVEEHDLAPDGSFAVLTRRVIDGDAYLSSLWLVPLDRHGRGGRPRRLTTGPFRDTRPAISPDCRSVAFTRRTPGEAGAATSIRVVAVAGGEPIPLPTGALDPSHFAWSPDGRWIAFRAEVDPQRFAVGPAQPGGTHIRARRITRLDYRYDEEGYLDRRCQLHVVPADGTGGARVLTDLASGIWDLRWRPDSRAIAVAADPRADADRRARPAIFEVELPVRGTGRGHGLPEARELLALPGGVERPAWSPDGRWIAGVGIEDPDAFDDCVPSLFVGPADRSAGPVALAPGLDRPIGQHADCDLTGWQMDARPGPYWQDRDAIVALVTDRGRTTPWRFPFDPGTGAAAGPPVRLAATDALCETLAVAPARITVTSTVGSRPPELCVVEGGSLRPITTVGSAWSRRLAWPTMRLVEAPGEGGPIETWIASPPDAGDEALPTIVDVHGGPLGAWAPAPSMEVVLLCARGYRVVLPNIRGSTSYGAGWITPQLGDWGGVDADDVHAALDHAIALGLADPRRLGALGLSYGGFMVNWLVGTSDRFRAAVSENGVVNQVSAWANSDTGPEYCRRARLGDPTTPEGVERLWRQSPLRHVAAIRTPLLLLQGEADLRCPPADAEQLFVALRWLGRDVEYVLYPEEAHLIQAAGRIDRRIDRMTRMLDWFDRFVLA